MVKISLLFFLISAAGCCGMLPSHEFFENEYEKKSIIKNNELLQGYFHYRTIELPNEDASKITQIVINNKCIAVITCDSKIYFWNIESGKSLDSSEKISNQFMPLIIHCSTNKKEGVKSPGGVYWAKLKQVGPAENPLHLANNIFSASNYKLVIRIKRSFESLPLDQLKVLNKKILMTRYDMKFTKTEKEIEASIPKGALDKVGSFCCKDFSPEK